MYGAAASQGKTDPEVKRKAIGSGFIDVFRDFAKTLKERHGVKPKFLVQVCAVTMFCPGLQMHPSDAIIN